MLKERIELNEADIRLFKSVKRAFETLAETYKDEFKNKYGNLVAKKGIEDMDFYRAIKNYEAATRDLNNLVERDTEIDDHLSESSETDQRNRLEELRRMFPKGEELPGKGKEDERQEQIEKNSKRIGLDPALRNISDATLGFLEGEGLLSGDFGDYK